MTAKKDHIAEQLASLNNHTKFHWNLSTPQLLTCLKSTTQSSFYSQTSIMPKIMSSISQSAQKSLYIGLKWLTFLHSAFQVARSSSLAEALLDLLPKLDHFTAKNKYEEYIMMKLIRPYRQYLGKLGRIVVQKLGGPSPNRHSSADSLELLFCEFNLLVFASEEFASCSQEFFGYFKQFYPCLNSYICLLVRDMYRIFKKIRLSNERKTLQNISDLEIQMIQSKISVFNKLNCPKNAYSWLFSQTSERSQKIDSPILNQDPIDNTMEQSQWGVAVSFFQS